MDTSKKQKVVICGSIHSNVTDITDAKKYYEEAGYEVIFPELAINSVLKTRVKYVKEIERADLVVIIPKKIKLSEETGMGFIIGESTENELAIAISYCKPIQFWTQDVWHRIMLF